MNGAKNIQIGDWLKCGESVFKVVGFTLGLRLIPDGWPVNRDGSAINPLFCEKYNGAKSVLNAL